MRDFVNISNSENDELNKRFPKIMDLANLEKVDGYNQYGLSVFDHWLSNEEAELQIDNILSESEELHNQKLMSFVLGLTDKTDVYLIKFLGKKKSKTTFRRFLSKEGVRRSLQPKNHLVSDSFRFRLLLPQLKTIYFEGSDFTHHFYTAGSTELALLRSLADENHLHVLK